MSLLLVGPLRAQVRAKKRNQVFLGPNQIANHDFERGISGWEPFGNGLLSAAEGKAQAGRMSLRVGGRSQTSDGAAYPVAGQIEMGRSYSLSCWVHVDGSTGDRVRLSIQELGAVPFVHVVDERDVGETGWFQLWGGITFEPVTPGSDLRLVVDGPAAGVRLFVDTVSLVELPDWRPFMDAQTERHRKRSARVLVRDAAGALVPNALIEAELVRPRFAFGSAVTPRLASDPTYLDFFLEHFEWAVFENETKWKRNEKQPGQLDYEDADAMATICAANGVQVRGHNVFWAGQQHVQSWVQALSPGRLRSAMEARIGSVVPRYSNLFQHWDVNNEMERGNWYSQRLGASIRPWMFQRVQQADPAAQLFTNELGVLTNPTNVHDYVDLVSELLAEGAPIGGIGSQGHFNRPVDPWALWIRMTHLGRLGLPLWITEFDYVTPDDAERADQWEALYRTVFAHPDAEGILAWGFWAGAHWRGPDAAIVDFDWTLNEAGRRYEALRAQWTTEERGRTDALGGFDFRGYHGRYRVTVTDAQGMAQVRLVDLTPGAGVEALEVQL